MSTESEAMALLNSSYSLQQGFYAAGVFPAPLANYSGFSLVGLRMQPPPFGSPLSTASMSGQLAAAFPGGSAASLAAAAAASFNMENIRAAHGLRHIPAIEASSPVSCGEKRAGVTDFSIEGILGKRNHDEHPSNRLDNIRAKHKLAVYSKNVISYQEKKFPTSSNHETTSSKLSDDDDAQETKTGEDGVDNPMTRFSWLQCTRYKPPRLPRTKRKDSTKKRKLGRNPRVPFSPTQVATLEQKFRCTHYLSSIDVAELSAALNLSENRVKIWFQNRRARERRDKESVDPKSQPTSTSSLLSPSPLSLPHSPHTPLSPLSSSPSSSTTPSSGLSFPSPSSSSISMSMSMSMSRLPSSPRSSTSLTSPHGLIAFSAPSASSPSSSSMSNGYSSSVVRESSPGPLAQPPHQHHLSYPSTDPTAGSAFTLVSPSLK